ncbi:hypothetical protein CI109_104039 [Kwoniella shandongensis]|uniref:NmrA-like domain-containing protein n=1 Tax=Kwoniella shandongensis TaxID=1734106 RepID=A0A5M6BXE4_9TREE|nr:uncharacterized protein CI109_004075 [Kwoniella shandongensis]KAA5527536.1 hypothetical protein CI109_004075 [Kwoniella shandongensis]
MSDTKNIVVFGATGLQGTALINALTKYNTSTSTRFNVFAFSRSPSAPSSTRLASLPGVEVVEVAKDYMDDPTKAFEASGLAKGEVDGVFSVQGYVSEAAELKQGKTIIDVAKEWGVKHFIYSSVDLGDLDDTKVPVFEVKRQIENHLKSSGLDYTILRPAQFMDNLLPTSPFMFKISRTILLRHTFINHPERKHQLISSADIGKFAALAFSQPSEWRGKTVSLAGDQLTTDEIESVYKEVLGKEVELTYWPLARFVKIVSPLGPMARFFDDHGGKVDVQQIKNDLPEVEDLRAFLQRYKASHQ